MPAPRQRTNLMLPLRSSGASLLRDNFERFTGSDIRTCEPGPGQWTTLDTGGKITTTNGERFASVTVSQTDPHRKTVDTYPRVPGRTFRITLTGALARVGWGASGSANADKIGYAHQLSAVRPIL